MPSTRIPSPARSQGAISTPRRDKLRRRTRSVCSPAQSNVPVRLSSLVADSYKLSPMPNRQSVLNDETDIEIVPGRQSWYKKLGDNSIDVMDVLETKDMAEIKNLADEFDVEVLSQEKQNYTLDLPESSDGESISSIVIPQRKLFTQKDHNHQKDFAQILNNRDSLSKHKSHIDHDKDIEVAPKNLFCQPSKPKKRPVFPAALLNISANKTMNKTKEMPVAEVKGQPRSLFGNRPGTKRKNMFADFIVSDSEDDISDIQPKVFGFQKNVNKNRRESASSRVSHHSPRSSIDLELDDWKLLPSSTLVGNQLEDTTPVKRARLSKLSVVKETETVSTINKTMNKTKQSNKSMNAKNKSKISSNSKLDDESSKLQDDKINVQSNDHGINSSTSHLIRSKSKSIRETSLTEANGSKTRNKSKNITNKDHSIVNKVDDNQENIKSQDGGNIQNELLDEGEDNENFTLQYENDDEQNNEYVDNNPNNCSQSKYKNDTLKQTSNKNILDKENQSVQEGTNKQENTNKSRQINNNLDIDMLDGNATKEPIQLNNKQEIQNINKEKLSEIENVKNKTNVSIHNTSKKHNKSKQDKTVETKNEVNQDNHNNTRNQIENKRSPNKSNYVSQEIGLEDDNHDQSKPIGKVNEEENENNEQSNKLGNEEENISSEQNNTDGNEEIASDIEDQNESRETQNESQDEIDQIDSEQEQNETEEQEEMEDDNHELNLSNKDEEDDFDTVQQDEDDVTSNHEEENESIYNKTGEQQNESVEINKNEDQDEGIEEQVMENEEEEDEEEEEDNDEEQEEDNDEEQEHGNDEEQEIENDHQESNESEVEENEDESEEVDQDSPNEEENDSEDEEVTENKNDESPNITHDTTGKHRNIQKVTSPEAILHDKTNQINSFMAEGRNTSVRKTKSILIKTLNIRPSLAPVRESAGFSDGSRNSSADNSGWDSHRTTRKTLRKTFGKDFTPRKSLRALVMEKSAKRHTNFMEKQADSTENVDNTKIPQANSTELPHFDSYEDPEPVHVDETAVTSVQESNRDEHEMSKRTRQTILEMHLQKIKQDILENKRKMEEERNSIKASLPTYNPYDHFKVPRQPVRRVQPAEKSKPRIKRTRPPVFILPDEIIEDLKYKPPKRFKPSNASWITKRLYKFLETKLEPRYDYKARVRAEKLVEMIYNFTKDVKKHHVAPLHMVDPLKYEMARLNIVTTHFDFYEFFQEYMPREIRIKVNPDIVNEIPLPKHGVFSDILR